MHIISDRRDYCKQNRFTKIPYLFCKNGAIFEMVEMLKDIRLIHLFSFMNASIVGLKLRSHRKFLGD